MNEIIVPAKAHSHGAARPKNGKKGKNGPVGYVKVNEGIWKAALLIAEGKVGRIEVITATNVQIWTVGGKAE